MHPKMPWIKQLVRQKNCKQNNCPQLSVRINQLQSAGIQTKNRLVGKFFAKAL
jgi:hypothetical protein